MCGHTFHQSIIKPTAELLNWLCCWNINLLGWSFFTLAQRTRRLFFSWKQAETCWWRFSVIYLTAWSYVSFCFVQQQKPGSLFSVMFLEVLVLCKATTTSYNISFGDISSSRQTCRCSKREIPTYSWVFALSISLYVLLKLDIARIANIKNLSE